MSKEQLKEKEQQLLELTGGFCEQQLNKEYFELCEKLIKKMGRKREVPFKRGKLEIWAAAIIQAIGSINFLYDKSFEPHSTTKQINDYFKTKQTTVSNKARIIKDMFDLWYFSPEFSTTKMEENNPFNNLVLLNGLLVPLDTLPPNISGSRATSKK